MWIGFNEAKEVARLLKERVHVDYPSFHGSYFRRRIGVVLNELGVKRLTQLDDLLLDPTFADQCAAGMLMPVGELFRDPDFWRTLALLLPKRFPAGSFQVWFPEASTGEEVYSMLILLQQLGMLDRAEVVVQSASKLLLDNIAAGILSVKNQKTNQENFIRMETNDRLESYVQYGDKQCFITPDLLCRIQFVHGWFPVTNNVQKADLVLCRNIGLMYSRLLCNQVAEAIGKVVDDNGILAIGVQEGWCSTQKIGLRCLNERERIFEKTIAAENITEFYGRV